MNTWLKSSKETQHPTLGSTSESRQRLQAQEGIQEKARAPHRAARRGARQAASFNNTHITITDPDGRAVCWSSAGAIGFKGSRKGTPYAAQQASLAAAGVARDQYGMKSVEVRVKGPGSGRESAVRALAAAGLHIVLIRTLRRFRTTAAVRRSAAAFDVVWRTSSEPAWI